MYISVNGRIARKKQVEIFIFDVLEHLMPRLKRKVNIDVNIVTRCDNQHYALCLGDKNCAEIELARGSCDTKFSLDEIRNITIKSKPPNAKVSIAYLVKSDITALDAV